jgi:hypothetical protein
MQKWIIRSKESIDYVLNSVAETLKHNYLGDVYEVVIQPYVYARTISQNSLYYAWMGKVVQWMRKKGYEVPDDNEKAKEVASMFFKKRFLGTETYKLGRWELEDQVRGTSSLSAGEMYAYMEKVHAWCINAGIRLPLPQDSEFYENRERNDG